MGNSSRDDAVTGKRSMFLFYFSITLAIASSALYHFSAKTLPM
jgi:hypothetical protein